MRYGYYYVLLIGGVLVAIASALFETFRWAAAKRRDPATRPKDKPSWASLIAVFVVAAFLIAILVVLLLPAWFHFWWFG